jgi:hypothetical protein
MQRRPVILALLAAAALLGAATALAAPKTGAIGSPITVPSSSTPAMTATLTRPIVGARPIGLTTDLTYTMQCGYPGPGPIVFTLPTAMRVPQTMSRSYVLVNGKPAVSVAVSGHQVSVGLAPAPQVMCDTLAIGTLTIAFNPGANLGNPSAPGTYSVRATRGQTAFEAKVHVKRR